MNKPNIVYILADDLGYGDVSCLNKNSKINTSNLDKLAKNGLCFTDAHASSAVCTPSRYSILTGRYNWRSALKAGVLLGYSEHLIEPGRMTVASMLKKSGYKTACIGKWHLGMDFQKNNDCDDDVDFSKPIKNGPNDYGFDYFYGISASLDMPPYVYIENNKATQVPTGETENLIWPRYWRKGAVSADFSHEDVLPNLTNKVLTKIDELSNEPFFIYFPLPSPHTPCLPTSEFQGSTGMGDYADYVVMTDDVVGRVVAKLEEKGILDNTIVIFTSDNGVAPPNYVGDLSIFGHNSSYIYRGHKADIYEGGHRIPLLIRWSNGIKPGIQSDEPVCLTDLMATLAELVGVTLPEDAGEDSISNLPIWLSKDYIKPLREAMVHHSVSGAFSIRKGNWKLELCPGSGGWSYPKPGEEPDDASIFQLYDLSKDISEKTNVIKDNKAVAYEMKELLKNYVNNGRSTKGEPQKNTGNPIWHQLSWMTVNIDDI